MDIGIVEVRSSWQDGVGIHGVNDDRKTFSVKEWSDEVIAGLGDALERKEGAGACFVSIDVVNHHFQ